MRALAQHFQRPGGTAAGPEPVRALLELSLEDRFQNELRCRLHHPIAHRRDAEWTPPPIGFRDVPAQNRCWPILACSQHGLDLAEEALLAVLLDHSDRLGIDSRCTLVP